MGVVGVVRSEVLNISYDDIGDSLGPAVVLVHGQDHTPMVSVVDTMGLGAAQNQPTSGAPLGPLLIAPALFDLPVASCRRSLLGNRAAD